MADLGTTRIDSPLNSPLPPKMALSPGKTQLSAQDKKQFHDNLGKNTKTRCCISASDTTAPNSRLSFEYLNKGAANAVFKIRPFLSSSSASSSFQFVDVGDDGNDATPLPYQEFSNKVLRVSRGKPKHLSGETILSSFKDAIHPLFLPGQLTVLKFANSPGNSSTSTPKKVPIQLRIPDLTKHLMDHQGILLMSSAMQHLMSTTEPDTFHLDNTAQNQDSLAPRLGILLPDMSPTPGTSLTLELKPKWLLQSPNAPSNAIRCRTCALQIAIPKDKNLYICPLRIVNGNIRDVRGLVYNNIVQAFQRMSNPSTPAPPLPSAEIVDAIVDALLEYLTQGEGSILLRHLRFLQGELDPQGVLKRDSRGAERELFDYNLRLAMTLRDCSLFVKIPYHSDTNATNATKNGNSNSSGGRIGGAPSSNNTIVNISQISSKLGDLDFKSAEKIYDWAGKEKSLQNGGLYTRKEPEAPACWLSTPSLTPSASS